MGETVGAANANNNEAKMFVPFLSLVLLLVVTSGVSAFQNEGCTDATCGDHTASRFSMPLTSLGAKKYYLGIFFKANWYKAEQYCRFHGMHLASVNSEEEQRNLEDHITSFGMGNEHFWSSGTDQGEEGKFVWMSTGRRRIAWSSGTETERASGGTTRPAASSPTS